MLVDGLVAIEGLMGLTQGNTVKADEEGIAECAFKERAPFTTREVGGALGGRKAQSAKPQRAKAKEERRKNERVAPGRGFIRAKREHWGAVP